VASRDISAVVAASAGGAGRVTTGTSGQPDSGPRLVFAASPGVTRAGVFLAAAGALVLSTPVAVAAGAQLQQWVRPEHLRIAAALGFIAIGVWMAVSR
jgi:hypothetical protein